MCKWMDKVVEGIEVFQVGKQQLWDWCGWTREGYRSPLAPDASIYMYADTLRKGVYVLVETGVVFGRRWGRSSVIASYTSLRKAVKHACIYSDFEPVAYETNKIAHEYEVWHIVDDAELWQEWDNASAAYVATHQPLAPQMQPVAIDSRCCDDFYETLYSVYVPMVGQNVSFLVVNRYSCGIWLEEEEYMPCDMQSAQPLTIEDCQWYNWMDHNDLYELWFSEQACSSGERTEQECIDAQLDAWDDDFDALDTLDSLRQLREAGEIYEAFVGV